MPSVYCCVKNCWKGGESKHRFPLPTKNKPLFDKWIILSGNRTLVSMTPGDVYNSRRICSRHFLPEDYGFNNRLKKGVLPSVNLPDPLEHVEGESVPSTSATMFELPIAPQDYAIPSTSRESPTLFEKNQLETEKDDGSSKQRSSTPLQKTPKKRSALLSEVRVSKIKDLTPKAKHLYQRALQFKRKAMKSKKSRLSLAKRLRQAEKFTSPKMFEEAVSSMDRIRERFFQSQVENVRKKPKGRRYTLEDKGLALALWKQSGVGYRFLSKVFALPSRKTVMRLLNRIPIRPGLHSEIFTVLKAETKNFKNPLDKHCVLMFDEISIQPNVQPNLKEGSVEGFEDFGFKKSEQIANHAQVFMLRGIKRKWKQPVYYNFVSGGTKKADLKNIIKLVIRKCHSVGLNVVATVCDQGANNQAAINELVKDTQMENRRRGNDKYDFHFEVDGQKIIPLFDVPHLFKGLRNNLIKYNLHFMDDGKGKLAKWSDIYTAYKMDPYLGSLRLMPKLTDSHVNPDRLNKMKVSKCTQVFSKSVAAAINVFAFCGATIETEEEVLVMDKSAADTASLLEFLDVLFDSLNGSSFKSLPGKVFRVGVTKESPHVDFWDQAIQKLRTFNFIKNGSFFSPPSLKNLIKTLKNFKDLWQLMRTLGFNSLMPRTFNQDPLENFFGKIRQRGYRNINPTPTDFTYYYKSLMVNQLTSSQSVGANCEDDKSEVFLTLQRLVSQGLPEEDDDDACPEMYCEVPDDLPVSLKPIEAKVLKYVAGYVFKKIGKQPCSCKDDFFKKESPTDFEDDEFLKFKEYQMGVARLQYINSAFLEKMKLALAIIKYILNRNLHKSGIMNYILKTLCLKVSLTSCFHDNKFKTQIFKYFIKINIFNYCKQLNRILKGLDRRSVPTTAPRAFLAAKKIYCNAMKRKKAQQK